MQTKEGHTLKAPTFLDNSPIGKKLAPLFKANSRAMTLIVILVLIGVIIGGYFLLQSLADGKEMTLSGTIEATEIHLGAEVSGLVDRVYVEEGEPVAKGQVVAVVKGNKIHSPIAGVVLEKAAHPGEVVGLGATIVVVGDLEALTLTVYVPEDRYGRILLNQTCSVYVDSYQGQTFSGKVVHIADKAEFTPRNVQTTDSRKNTVYAIKIKLDPSAGFLKPGMPADVQFQIN